MYRKGKLERVHSPLKPTNDNVDSWIWMKENLNKKLN